MPQRDASEVGSNGRCVCVEDIVEGADCGVHGFTVNRWDCGVLEDLDKLIERSGLHGGGGKK